MNGDRVLYKLGIALVPALIAVPGVEGAVLVSFMSVVGILLAHGLSSPLSRIRSRGLRLLLSGILLAAGVTGFTFLAEAELPALAQAAGIFYPVLLLNGILLAGGESLEAKVRFGLGFVLVLLAGCAAKAFFYKAGWEVPAAFIFIFVGIALAFLRKRVREK